MKLAAIDVGSNSIHLMIVRLLPDHSYETIYRDKATVRLGGGRAFARGQLSADAQRRGVSVLRRFAQVIQKFEVDDVVGVATSAVREAENGTAFLREVRRQTGLRINRISGQEEARLVAVAVSALPPFNRGRWLVIDIGGGSTELARLDNGTPRQVDSLKVGCVRLAEGVTLEARPGKKGLRRLRSAAHAELGGLNRRLGATDVDGIVGTSGTIVCLTMRAARRARQTLVRGQTFRVKRTLVEKELAALAELSLKERTLALGEQGQRADVILPGGAILLELLEPLPCPEIHVPDRSIRDGLIVDYVQQKLETTPAEHERDLARIASGRTGNPDDPHTLRERTLVAFARRYEYDAAHAHQVLRLSAELFDATAALHRLGPEEKFLLEAAALLHDIGQYISYSQHHKHSQYLIRNAQLTGFNEREIQVIGCVARYHRKALPALTHAEFNELAVDDRRLVQQLAALLRIADGLDYGHLSSVERVRLDLRRTRVVARLVARQECRTEVERALRKSDLFTRVFGRSVGFTVSRRRTTRPGTAHRLHA